ncbi:sigma-70 family RNA polymerase sigma factor [Bradyrhizobium genosp. P]|uniref:sigma-70 family RNA polymerase sigma factor n=1 Tax=Bradyrhizobium genosp. P TaxID=83641 RepID=UPI003CF33C38
MESNSREYRWATWMRAAINGDVAAYRLFLESVTPFLRTIATRRCMQFGLAWSEAEDIVQEALLAIHLKRGTWDRSGPIGPWISAVVRNKVIDAFRRRGRRIDIPIENVIDTLEVQNVVSPLGAQNLDRLLSGLKERPRRIVTSISVEGASIRETAERLQMTEVAVRVALHRALKSLAALYQADVS